MLKWGQNPFTEGIVGGSKGWVIPRSRVVDSP